jgi:chromosome segregation ATPase
MVLSYCLLSVFYARAFRIHQAAIQLKRLIVALIYSARAKGVHVLTVFGNEESIEVLRQNFEKENKALQKSIDQLTEHSQTLNTSMQIFQRQFEDLNVKNRELGANVEILTTQNTYLEQTIQSIKENVNTDVSVVRAQMEAQINELKTENKALNQQLDYIANVLQENAELEQQIHTIFDHNLELEQKIEKLESNMVDDQDVRNHMNERLQYVYYLYLQKELPELKIAYEAKLRQLDKQMRDINPFFREVFDDSIIQKFMAWQ